VIKDAHIKSYRYLQCVHVRIAMRSNLHIEFVLIADTITAKK